MLKFIFAFFMLIHGIIHVMGFAKANNYGNITQLTKDISKPMGGLWLLTAILFVAAIILFLRENDKWWIVGIIAAILSQALIFTVWQDAKFGTIANIIILIPALFNTIIRL